MKAIYAATACLLLTACMSTGGAYEKPGGTEAEAKLTAYQCRMDATRPSGAPTDVFFVGPIFEECMAAHGWRKVR